MKIVALTGMLGYGYSEEALNIAFSEKVDYVGVDAGSTDPGPYYLGSGKSFTDKNAVARDLRLALPKALNQKAKFIIGTAGGCGSREHTDWLKNIIYDIAKEEKLEFKMGVIYSDVSNDYVLKKFKDGKITNMSPEFPLNESDILNSKRIVSQIGAEPIIRMLNEDVDVILCGRACDTAIYAAPCIFEGYDPGLSFHMAKIMECGAMCSEPVAAADVMQGYMFKDRFELVPANPIRKCTVDRVAAHTLYEQTNPYLIFEPDGVVDLSECNFTQKDERTVSVTGSRFIKADKKTLKLEGVKQSGYRTISPCSVYDKDTIENFDKIISIVSDFVSHNLPDGVTEEDYILNFRTNGGSESSLGVIIDVVGKTKSVADTICSLARSRTLHCDFSGRKSTAGNLAFPFSPSDIHVGEVYEFSVFHLAEVDDFCETSETVIEEVGM